MLVPGQAMHCPLFRGSPPAMPPNDERSRPFIPPEDGDFPDSPFRSDGTWPQEDVVDSPSPSGGLSTSVDRGEHAAADTYWSISRRPLTSLVFSLPLVLAYEGGVLLLGRGSPRNGADVWLRTLLDHLGFGQYFLLPVLTVLGLLAWHHIEHDRWRFSPAVLVGMAGESILWAAVLLGVARLQDRFWPLAAGAAEGVFARLVAFCGAGLYEEVLFRLLLLPAVGWLAARLGRDRLEPAVQLGPLRRAARRCVRSLQLHVPVSGRRVLRVALRGPRLRDRGRQPRGLRHPRRTRSVGGRCGG